MIDVVNDAFVIVSAVLASSGFWAWLQKRSDKKDWKTKMIMGLGHDRILYLGMTYIARGYVTPDEYENLHEYLYVPYEKMGGNGSARRIMDEVRELPHSKEQAVSMKGGL